MIDPAVPALDATTPTLTNAAAAGVAASPVYQDGSAPVADPNQVAGVIADPGVAATAALPIAAPTTDAQYQAAWQGMAPEQIASSINQTPADAAGNTAAASEEYRLAWQAENQGNYMGLGNDPLADVWGQDAPPVAVADPAALDPASMAGASYADAWGGAGDGGQAGGEAGSSAGDGAADGGAAGDGGAGGAGDGGGNGGGDGGW